MTRSAKKKQKRLESKVVGLQLNAGPSKVQKKGNIKSAVVSKPLATTGTHLSAKAQARRLKRQEITLRTKQGFIPGNKGTLSELIDRTNEKTKRHEGDEEEDIQMDMDKAEQMTAGASSSRPTTDRTYYREFLRVVEAADVILQILDARDPLGTRCSEVENTIKNQRHKRLVLVLNKADLVPKENLQEWITYLRGFYPTVAFKASTQSQGQKLGQAYGSVTQNSEATLQSAKSVGAKTLLALLGNYTRNKDVKTAIRVGVVGYPNVGKSSLINSLKRSKACQVGNTPGVTKCMQEIQLDSKIKLLDCPGMVLSNEYQSSSSSAELKNAVKVEQIEDPIPLVEQVLQRCEMSYFMDKYGVSAYRSADHFVALLAIKLGKLKRGGVPDREKAARIVLSDWNNGKIRYFSVPPETEATSQVSATVLSSFSAEFNLDSIDAMQKQDMEVIEDEAVAREAEELLHQGKKDVNKTKQVMDHVRVEVKKVAKSTKKREKKALEYLKDVGPEAFGPLRLKRLARKREKKLRKDRNRRDRVAKELSDGLEKAFAAI